MLTVSRIRELSGWPAASLRAGFIAIGTSLLAKSPERSAEGYIETIFEAQVGDLPGMG
jgi:hypothetical protein